MVHEPSQATEYNPWKSGEPASMWSALSAQSFDTTVTIQEGNCLEPHPGDLTACPPSTMVALPCHMRVKEEVKLTMTADYCSTQKPKKAARKETFAPLFKPSIGRRPCGRGAIPLCLLSLARNGFVLGFFFF
jgi:hypothetical protein